MLIVAAVSAPVSGGVGLGGLPVALLLAVDAAAVRVLAQVVPVYRLVASLVLRTVVGAAAGGVGIGRRSAFVNPVTPAVLPGQAVVAVGHVHVQGGRDVPGGARGSLRRPVVLGLVLGPQRDVAVHRVVLAVGRVLVGLCQLRLRVAASLAPALRACGAELTHELSERLADLVFRWAWCYLAIKNKIKYERLLHPFKEVLNLHFDGLV